MRLIVRLCAQICFTTARVGLARVCGVCVCLCVWLCLHVDILHVCICLVVCFGLWWLLHRSDPGRRIRSIKWLLWVLWPNIDGSRGNNSSPLRGQRWQECHQAVCPFNGGLAASSLSAWKIINGLSWKIKQVHLIHVIWDMNTVTFSHMQTNTHTHTQRDADTHPWPHTCTYANSTVLHSTFYVHESRHTYLTTSNTNCNATHISAAQLIKRYN